MRFYGGLMGFFMGHTRPGKRLQKTIWKDPPFLMGKSTINGQFSIAMLNYQRVPGLVNKQKTMERSTIL